MKTKPISGTILIVDDELENLHLLSQMLTGNGYKVRAVKTGREAIASVSAEQPDLILLDIRLPDISGYEVCTILKANVKTNTVPVIFVSALIETAEKLHGFNAGGLDFITKPLIHDEVLIRVQTHIELSRLRTKLERQAVEMQIKNEQLQAEVTERKYAAEKLDESRKKLEDGKTAALNLTDDLKTEVGLRRKKEEELRETNERFLIACRAGGIGIWELNLVNNNLIWDEQMFRLYGITNDVFEGTYDAWRAGMHPEDINQSESELRMALSSDKEFDTEFRVVWPDGTIRNIRALAKIQRDASGKAVKFLGTNYDITEQKQTEQALKDAKENLEQRVKERTTELEKSNHLLYETGRLARVGGWELDIKTNELSWSDMVNRIHELEPGYHPVLETAIQFYAPEAIPVISEAVRLAIEEGKAYDEELQLITAKGNRLWVRAIGQAYRENGEIVKLGGIFQDINERKLAEQERESLLQRIKNKAVLIESANKELEAFSYSVSHDLRAPLRAIDGFSKIILEEYETKLDDEGKRLFEVIRSNINKMDKLISDILSLSRVSRIEIRFSRIDMTSLANSIYHEITTPEVRGKFEFTVAKLPDANGDTILMRQVWSNLLSNAVKYTMPCEIRKIEIGSRQEEGMNVYFIKDSGVGFNPEYKYKLFGVFQRLHSIDEFEGTGVGLAIVQRIIHRHSGEVWAEGNINKGAAIYFSLQNS